MANADEVAVSYPEIAEAFTPPHGNIFDKDIQGHRDGSAPSATPMYPNSLRWGKRDYSFGSSQIMTLIGVGLNPLQGLFTCGQFEMTKMTSSSIETST